MHVSKKNQPNPAANDVAKQAAAKQADIEAAEQAEAEQAKGNGKPGKARVIATGKTHRVMENDVRRWKEPVK